MNVLSLFDGISGGRVALERANITVDKYYASEIDKWAIAISKKNYPDIIQLGDINNWRNWDIDWKSIDLLFAGFCCQSWSQAGKQQGDKDPRGALMWVMLDIFNHVKTLNPNVYFLFENVKMKKEFLDYVNKAIGCESILINSALVSAQNRQRNYWTNIPNVTQPEDKRIYLKDIIEYGEVDRDKSYCIDANYYKGGSLKNYLEKSRRQLVLCQSEQCLMVKDYAPRFTPNQLQYDISGKNYGSQDQWAFFLNGKHGTLSASGTEGKCKLLLDRENLIVRKLSVIEVERLQTLSDNFTALGINEKGQEIKISNSQRYKCCGNGWTIDVISHILKGLKIYKQRDKEQKERKKDK